MELRYVDVLADPQLHEAVFVSIEAVQCVSHSWVLFRNGCDVKGGWSGRDDGFDGGCDAW